MSFPNERAEWSDETAEHASILFSLFCIVVVNKYWMSGHFKKSKTILSCNGVSLNSVVLVTGHFAIACS